MTTKTQKMFVKKYFGKDYTKRQKAINLIRWIIRTLIKKSKLIALMTSMLLLGAILF